MAPIILVGKKKDETCTVMMTEDVQKLLGKPQNPVPKEALTFLRIEARALGISVIDQRKDF